VCVGGVGGERKSLEEGSLELSTRALRAQRRGALRRG
jgi:hypothetical protein